MELKHFYFIDDSFFDFADDVALMQNKEDDRKRPCFFAVKDEDGILWMIPISSRVKKFQEIYQKKIEKYGNCDTIVFAPVLGQLRAFLIQNMFPITKDFIAAEYLQSPNNNPVMISELYSKTIVESFKKVLAMVRKGNRFLVFPDVLRIESLLKSKNVK